VFVITIDYYLILHCHSRGLQIFAKMLVHGLSLTIPMSKLILIEWYFTSNYITFCDMYYERTEKGLDLCL
jgi:hypothetical protein